MTYILNDCNLLRNKNTNKISVPERSLIYDA
jgi:hypothetical protein